MITSTTQPTAITKALGLKADASEAEVLAAIERRKGAATPNPARLEQLVQDAIAFGISSRRLLRIQRPWAERFARKDPDGFVEFLRGAPEVGFETATAEMLALVHRRIDESGRKTEFSAALAQVARVHPEVLDDVRGRLEFSAGAAVSDEEAVHELAREHPHLVEEARKLVDASGRRIDYAEAMDEVTHAHPELVAEVRRERDAAVAAAARPPVSDGPVAQEFRRAVELIQWADGVGWDEAARRVHASHPELKERLARERGER